MPPQRWDAASSVGGCSCGPVYPWSISELGWGSGLGFISAPGAPGNSYVKAVSSIGGMFGPRDPPIIHQPWDTVGTQGHAH